MTEARRSSLLWPTPTPDRRRVGVAGRLAVAGLVTLSFWSALSASIVSLPDGSGVGLQASVVTAALAVLGLPSIPLRWIVRATTVVGGIIVIFYGTLGAVGGVGGALPVLGWLASSVAALALCPSPVRARDRDHVRDEPGRGVPLGAAPTVVLALVGMALGASLVLGGPASQLAEGSDAAGRRPDPLGLDPVAPLSASQRLDMTQRPRLSDQVVLTVRSELVSFWRSAVYDQWDGTTWTRSDRGAYFRIPPSGEVLAASTDVAGQSGRRTTQQFRIEAGAAVSMPVAASPVAVSGLDDVAQSIDGELVSLRGLGRGATYRVTSRQVPVVPDVLRAASPDDVPEDVLDRYAARPVATPRVRELAREVTRGATNDYDRVLALIGWMDANTRYSLDAPLAPDGVDVVDHFLFDSQLGWCEQIASSLVVMLREVGVPARLATGYVPGEWDPVGGRFVVRERDAHAWAEVWFAGAGWVPFDPTADVPLAGEPDADAAELPAGAGALGVALLAVALVAVSVRPLLAAARSLQRRASDRLRRRRLARRHWDVAAEQRLERLGRRAGRPRGPGDTVPAHAAELAERCADRRLVRVGELLDAARYGPGDVAEEDRRFVDEVLDEVGPT